MNWFRFHHEALTDPKVQTLPPDLFRAWVNTLCMASLNDPRGHLPTLRVVAFYLQQPEKKARAILDELVSLNLLEVTASGGWASRNWEERQRRSDTSVERVRNFRERKRGPSQVTPPVTLHPTLHETDQDRSRNATSNGAVTFPARSRESLESRERDTLPPPNPPLPIPATPAPSPLRALSEEEHALCQSAQDQVMGWGPLTERAIRAGWRLDWLREALTVAWDAKASRWKFVETVLVRFQAAGASDAERQAAAQAQAPPANGNGHAPHRPPAEKLTAKQLHNQRLREALRSLDLRQPADEPEPVAVGGAEEAD